MHESTVYVVYASFLYGNRVLFVFYLNVLILLCLIKIGLI